MRRLTRRRLIVSVVLWLTVVVGINVALLRYSNTPGESAAAIQQWPIDSQIERTPGKATLVVFAHPHCSCTRATLSELERLLHRVGDRVRAYVVFTRPVGVDDAWLHSDLWEQAAALGGVTVIADAEDGEAHKLGVKTSGTTLLADADGIIRFSGGLTASRGHEGPSVGQERIAALVLGASNAAAHSDVFGCALDTPPRLELAGAAP